jgi:hypothetical protein
MVESLNVFRRGEKIRSEGGCFRSESDEGGGQRHLRVRERERDRDKMNLYD